MSIEMALGVAIESDRRDEEEEEAKVMKVMWW
jgi:hypothetical protein